MSGTDRIRIASVRGNRRTAQAPTLLWPLIALVLSGCAWDTFARSMISRPALGPSMGSGDPHQTSQAVDETTLTARGQSDAALDVARPSTGPPAAIAELAKDGRAATVPPAVSWGPCRRSEIAAGATATGNAGGVNERQATTADH